MKISDILLIENIGYKVMRYENGKAISGANSTLSFNPTIGSTVRMPGKGIYMSNRKDYVLDYYSGLADNEILITFKYDQDNMTFGNLDDKEAEIAVTRAEIINVEEL